MQFISVTSARKQLSGLVEAAERVVITKAGQPEAVLLPLEDYQALMVSETLAQNPENFARIVAAHQQVLSGDLSETELHSRKSSPGRSSSSGKPRPRPKRQKKKGIRKPRAEDESAAAVEG